MSRSPCKDTCFEGCGMTTAQPEKYLKGCGKVREGVWGDHLVKQHGILWAKNRMIRDEKILLGALGTMQNLYLQNSASF
eukprot:1149258-Pelagomonas_calceolata.AAC.6